MKTIKVKFIGFEEHMVKYYKLDLYRILTKYYRVEISDDPDYVICSCFGEPYEYCKYSGVRIMITEENFIPDLNYIDYIITPYPIHFLDRSFTLPVWVCPISCPGYSRAQELETKIRRYDKSLLSQKRYFANFIYSHESEHNYRGDFFRQLSQYKRIESPGTYLNNMKHGQTVSFMNDSKTQFQRKCKFTLCFESTKHEGFITEKIVDAFYADTIPVYYGSSTISETFHPNAFINCNDFNSIDDVIERIIMIDKDDEAYLEIMNQPIYQNNSIVSSTLAEYERFIKHIFDQPHEIAYRRSMQYSPHRYENYILDSKEGKTLTGEVLVKEIINRALNRIQLLVKKH